jgi:CDP-paratose 2-epimerase
MNILITGGCGFVGSSLALYFKSKYPSYQISVIDNLKRRGSEMNIARLRAMKIDFMHADIRNAEDLSDIEAMDLILDCSAEASVLAGIGSSRIQVINNNLIGTINCLELALKHKSKFLFLSTSRVYPIEGLEGAKFEELETRFVWTDNQNLQGISSAGIAEKFPLDGYRSLYGATKLASELIIKEYHHLFGLETIINRCGVLSGPWQMGKVDQGVTVLWLARHFFKNPLIYNGYGGKGKQLRDILHIADLANLLDLQIHNWKTGNGEIYNVGGGLNNSASLMELTQIAQKLTGNKIEIKSVMENRAADIRIYYTDNSKVNKAYNWKPLKNINAISTDIFNWIEQNQQQLKPILS